ncbi:interleukin-1 beta [Hoplias malabaricus]|uniref:interleukin-1 beta n=1 Tax=Hoplias malabaricus TaxID=27720 RepID=UPI003462ED29
MRLLPDPIWMTLSSAFYSFLENDSAFESDEMDCDEIDCSDPLALSGRCTCHEGLQIEIFEQPHSMRKVANIIIALQKLQKFTSKVQSTEFTEHEIFKMIMENVIEESVVTDLRLESSKTYSKQDKVIRCAVCDNLKKTLLLNNQKSVPILLAATLKGGNTGVYINLSAYTTAKKATDGQPVCLGIAQSNLYLACTEVSGIPHLTLEEVKDKDTLKLIKEDSDMKKFLFLRQVTGVSVNTFESVKYRGWFISTSNEEYKHVDMCEAEDKNRQKVFSLQDQTVI